MMTRTIRTGIAAAALLLAPIAAQAADLRQPNYKAPAYVAPAYANWTGFYVGLNGGYGFGSSNWTGFTKEFNVTGAMIGGTIGYNMQMGVWVWGLEGDIGYNWLKGSSNGTGVCVAGCETQNDWLGTARGRFGYAWDRWLPYITAGAAFGDIKTTPAAPDTYTSTMKVGWTAGLGVEYSFMGPWSAKLEYLYTDLGKGSCASASCGAGIDVPLNINIIRAGMNYRF
jgi:outer membrane immunogenic protein